MKKGIVLHFGLLIAAAVVLVYLNSLPGDLVFDDEATIVQNPHLKRLWPPGEAVAAPPRSPLRDRPVVSLSLSLNRALTGPSPVSYRGGNILIHLAAALFLFGILRRTFLFPRLPPRYRSSAVGLALASTLFWSLHPLQTQSVTYITQRCESLMGLFFLGTLYAFIRGTGSSRPRRWYCLSVILCALGMGSKAVMATAPVIVLCYDRIFTAAGWREIWRRRRWFYLALILTLAVQAALLLTTSYEDIKSHGPLEYGLSQFGVITHYLRLSLYPRPLILDYHWLPARSWPEVWPGLPVVLSLLVLTAGALKKYPPLGFAGFWFFLILAPTSSLLPLEDLAFEHRMYLPLAALAALGTAGGFELLRKLFPGRPERRRAWGIALTVIIASGLGTLTARRNRDYHSAAGIWEGVIARRPRNPRAYNSLGNIVLKEGNPGRAEDLYRRAIEVSPRYQPAHYNLANLLAGRGELEEAVVHYRKTLKINPGAVEAHNNLGIALFALGEVSAARAHFLSALEIDPLDPAAHYNLGLILFKRGDAASALPHLERAFELRPDHPPARQALEAARQRVETPE